jgi:hypothetical protein
VPSIKLGQYRCIRPRPCRKVSRALAVERDDILVRTGLDEDFGIPETRFSALRAEVSPSSAAGYRQRAGFHSA